MLNLKEIISRPEYKWLEEYKDRLCFITLGGSHAYGTNVETSDIDIRGVMLPTKEELIGLKNFEQRLDEETDTCIYEFNKFVRLILNSNPNTIEMLGCNQYIIFNEVGRQLIDNAKLFLSKKCLHSFGGYAQAQLRRIECASYKDGAYSEEEKAKHMKATMDVAINKLSETNEIFKEDCVKVNIQEDKVTLDVHLNNKPLPLVRATLNDLLTIERTYNKIGQRNNKKDEAHLNKHTMHLIRLYLTCFDILEKGELHTYRENDREYLLEVRNGKYLVDGKLTDEFYAKLRELEERLEKAKELNVVPNKPNYDEIEKFVVEVNTKVITNTVSKYKEPLEEIIIN